MFDKIQALVASALGGGAVRIPETPLRIQAHNLLTTVERARAEGDWPIGDDDIASDAMGRLRQTLESDAIDLIVGKRTLDLVDVCVPAIATGEWTIGAEELDALFDASSAAGAFTTANDDPRPAAVAV